VPNELIGAEASMKPQDAEAQVEGQLTIENYRAATY
jgi:hypothetical protein